MNSPARISTIIIGSTLVVAACGLGGKGKGGQAPPPPVLSGGSLGNGNYLGTQSPGDWWSWVSNNGVVTGQDLTSTVSLGALTATDQQNGYYELSGNGFLAFAVAQGEFSWILPVSGPANTAPAVAFNPIVAAPPAPCINTPGTLTFNVVNFTNRANYNPNQFWTMAPIVVTLQNIGNQSTLSIVSQANYNNVDVNITGLTCSGGVWSGGGGISLIGSGNLLIGDLGTNLTTGFPAGTTGFIAMLAPAQAIDVATLNQAHFVMADVIPTTADTADPGTGRFLIAGVLGGTNTQDNLLHVYSYGGCQAVAASDTYPTSANHKLTEVGDYAWAIDNFGHVGIQYAVPANCGFGGSYMMIMGQLSNGKLIGLPLYTAVGGDIGAPVLVEE